MAGCSGCILSVGLLGCTRTCQMAQQSHIASLGGMYRTAGGYRGQMPRFTGANPVRTCGGRRYGYHLPIPSPMSKSNLVRWEAEGRSA